MSRFRVEYTKFHVRAIIRPRRSEVQSSEKTATAYFPEGRLWLIASDIITLSREIIRESDGYYLKIVAQPVDSDVKFLLRDKFHGIYFSNVLKREEELIIYIQLWKFRSRPKRVRKGPRQIFKLLNNIEKFFLSYWDPHIQVYYSRYLPSHVCIDYPERQINLTLQVRDLRITVVKTKCHLVILPLRRGTDYLIFIPQALVRVCQFYPHLGREVKLVELDCLRHGVVLVVIK